MENNDDSRINGMQFFFLLIFSEKQKIMSDTVETVISKNKIPIRLTYKQWVHITDNHDYMSGCRDMVLETVAEPDIIIRKGILWQK